MNVDELISKATHTSGRSIIVVSAIVLFSHYYEYPMQCLPLLFISKHMPIEMIRAVSISSTLLLLVSHSLNWWNDHTGYQASFIVDMLKRLNRPEEEEKIRGLWTATDWKKDRRKLSEIGWAQWMSVYLQHMILPVGLGLRALATLFSSPEIATVCLK